MQVSVETTGGLERRLTIVVPSEQFENRIQDKLTEARGQVRLPGFRPGKVPLKEVRRRFGQAVRHEVAGELMQQSFVTAVQQEDLSPAGSPSLDVVKMDPGIDFEFTATFEVFPEVEPVDFAQVAVKRPVAGITDTDVDNMVARLREQRAEFVAVDRAAAAGDRVTVDFTGTQDGEPFEGGSGEGVQFEVGGGQMIEDFDAAVVGAAAGADLEFDATFPDDYRAEHLAGQTVHFAVHVDTVEERREPALDETFFEAYGVTEGGEPAFREEIRQNMQREMDAAVRNQIKQQVMDQIHKLHDIPVPGAMVHREIHALKDEMLQQFRAPPGRDFDLPDDLFEDRARQRVTVGLVVNAIITRNDLDPDPARLDARLQELAAPYDEPEQVIRYFRSNAEQLQQIEMAVLEDQVVDLILEKASITDVETDYEGVINGSVIAPEPDTTQDAAADEGAGEAPAQTP